MVDGIGGCSMSFLNIVGSLIEPITGILDEVIHSGEEKAEAKLKVMALLQSATTEEQKEITKRWEADAKSGVLAKNVRPGALIFLTLVFVIITFMDGNVGGFQLNPAYVTSYQTLLMLVYGAYFGSRALEKVKGVAK
jgi:hypothetical protein